MKSVQVLGSLVLGLSLSAAIGLQAQVATEVPPVAPGAQPVTVEHIKIHGKSLEGNLEGDAVDRDVIVPIGSVRAFLLRDRTIPLVDLADLLGISRDVSDQKAAKVVIMSAAGQIGAIEVDRLGDRLDVMLKPMEGLLGGMRGVEGTTLLGDGRVLVVLDVQEIFG